jgi:hypothetical protein
VFIGGSSPSQKLDDPDRQYFLRTGGLTLQIAMLLNDFLLSSGENKMRDGRRGRNKLISLVRAFALFSLTAHAALINAIHFHSFTDQHAASSIATLARNHPSDSNRPAEGGHADCLSCRLQRNFIADVLPPSVLFDPVSEPLTRQHFFSEPHIQSTYSTFSSRAPPMA